MKYVKKYIEGTEKIYMFLLFFFLKNLNLRETS